ncbi:NUMOD3 domain-containing DNA-binding protein [Trichocoleus desertorum AS-A10]|uniref:NUMOD3 domain-containing DNA-binding protein n=1 Tax=Trichocoleus desertorum TaxID=1481672 RepID=UPI003297620B
MAKVRPCTVYGLTSSKDGKIRYIGQTIRPLKVRLQKHILEAQSDGQTPKSRWIRKVLEQGYTINILPLKENATHHEDEIKLIAEYRASGYELLNLVDGGQGCLNPSPELRTKMSERWKKYHANPLNRKLHIQKLQQQWQDPDFRERVRTALLKVLQSPEYKEKISRSSRRMYEKNPALREQRSQQFKKLWQNPEHRKMISEKQRQRMNEPEVKARMAESQQKRWSDPAAREAISKRMKGRKFSPETIEKMRAAAKRRVENNPDHYKGGHKHSEESRQKMKEVAQKRCALPEGKQQLANALRSRWEKYRKTKGK